MHDIAAVLARPRHRRLPHRRRPPDRQGPCPGGPPGGALSACPTSMLNDCGVDPRAPAPAAHAWSTPTPATGSPSARSSCPPAGSRPTTATATSCISRSTSRRFARRGLPRRGRAAITRTIESLDPVGAWPTWVLGNHDSVRPRSRYGTDERARAAAVLLLTLRGTPFLYAGDELGLEDAVVQRLAGARSRRSRRMPRADPLGEGAAPRLGRTRRRGCRFRPIRPRRRRKCNATIPRRCSGSTETSSRCDGVRTRSARGRSSGSRGPTGCSSTSAATDTDR